MPEGPDVRMVADKVAATVKGRPLLAVRFGPPELRQHEAPLGASSVTTIDTHGKAMLTRFACGWTVFTHLYSFGRWHFTAPGEAPDIDRTLRFGLYTATGDALLYSATVVEVVPTDEVPAIPYMAALGPDCLAPDLDADTLLRHMEEPRFARRQVGLVLLDQAFIAGIGNYLRCEVMFAAGVHPKTKFGALDRPTKAALARAALEIPRRTLRDKGLDFMVFMRNRKPCMHCRARIVREMIGGRPCSWCPQCQPEHRR